MAAAPTPIPVEEYLTTSYEPECEYVDGELIPKAMGTADHSSLQTRLAYFLFRYELARLYRVRTEQSLRLREHVVLIPDLCVLPYDNSEPGVVTEAPVLCIEILSPSDRFSYTVKKCEEYIRWGVLACWIFDPVEKTAWSYHATGLHSSPTDGMLRAGDIELSLADVWED